MCKILKSVIFISLIFLFMTNIFACPELSGLYRCRSRDSEQNHNLIVITEFNDGVGSYLWSPDANTNDRFIADGVERELATFEDSGEMDLTYQATCESEALLVAFKAVIYEDSQKVGSMNYKLTASLNRIGDLIQNIKGTTKINDQEVPFEYNLYCSYLLRE